MYNIGEYRFRDPAKDPEPIEIKNRTGRYISEYRWLRIVRSDKLCKVMDATQFRIYWVLYAYIIRGEVGNKLYSDYYKNDQLVASVSKRHIAKLTGMSRNTIKIAIDDMEKKHVLKQTKSIVNGAPQRTIYVLGEVIYDADGNKSEVLFLEKVAL